MLHKKQIFVRMIFLVELCLFVYGYGWGRKGIVNLYVKRSANQSLLQEIARERELLDSQKEYLRAWQTDPFYKEQYAREQLHMARKEDIVYINS